MTKRENFFHFSKERDMNGFHQGLHRGLRGLYGLLLLRRSVLVLTGGYAGVLFKKRGKIIGRVKREPVRDLRNGQPLFQELSGMCNFHMVDESPGRNPGFFPEFRLEAGDRETTARRGVFEGNGFFYMLMDIDDGLANLVCLKGLQLPGKQDDAIEAADKKLLPQRLCNGIRGRKAEKRFPELVFQNCVSAKHPGQPLKGTGQLGSLLPVERPGEG